MSEIWPQIIDLGPSTDVAVWKREQERKRNTMSKEPKFCNKCGEGLLASAKIGEYDIYDGSEVVISKTFRCPHYSRIFGKGHFLLTLQFDIPDFKFTE